MAFKPNEDLFFNLTLIPLGSTETESILINNYENFFL